MGSHTAAPFTTSVIDATQNSVVVANTAVDMHMHMPVDSEAWAPVPALRSAQQDRLTTDMVTVLHTWMKRIRPGLWRNPLGEPYPK